MVIVKKIIRQNIKAHTENIHRGMKVYERPEKMKSLTTKMCPAPNKSKFDNLTSEVELEVIVEKAQENEVSATVNDENKDVINKLESFESNVK